MERRFFRALEQPLAGSIEDQREGSEGGVAVPGVESGDAGVEAGGSEARGSEAG